MDREENIGHYDLERMLLDRSAEPMCLPLSLIQEITNYFSEQIGRGGFAEVYKGRIGHGLDVAVKKLTKTFRLERTEFQREVECLVKANHKNIVRFLGYCVETQEKVAKSDEGKFIMADTRNWLLCFEYVPNGSLRKYIKDASCGLEWRTRFEIIKGICKGLCYLHEKRILHLDLKPDNILLDDHMVPKIIDFGLSRCLDEEQTMVVTKHICGTRGYVPQEFFSGKVAFTTDIYSIGVIVMEILTGMRGYPEDTSVVQSWMNRLDGDRDTQLEQVRLCRNIGIECMDSDPEKRPSARQIIDRLDKAPNIVETAIDISLVEQEVSLLKEQHYQERTGNTPAAEIENVTQCIQMFGNDQCQEKEHHSSMWGSQDTKQDQKYASISSYNSSGFQNLSTLDIFHEKSRSNFLRNGGPTIQRSNSVKIFLEEELKPILNSANLVGGGAFGEVYQGILGERLVTVRKPIAGSLLQNEQFANEVIQRSQVIHKNIVRLIGCCLEVDIPMLVYDLFSSRSLDDILHSNRKVPLNLDVRLRIAAQAADGIAFMHAKTDGKSPFFHLEAANILLDDNFVPKISDFGISGWIDEELCGYFFGGPAPPVVDNLPGAYFVGRPAPSNGGYFIGRPADFGIPSSLTNALPGDYFVGRPANQVFMENSQLTQESDVYNFGVVVLELISRKKAIDDDNSLVRDFLNFHAQGEKATTLLDKAIAGRRELSFLHGLVEIAVECLCFNVTLRPKMTEIADRLLRLSRKYTG